jgi:hypothetical protein
VFIQIFNEHF